MDKKGGNNTALSLLASKAWKGDCRKLQLGNNESGLDGWVRTGQIQGRSWEARLQTKGVNNFYPVLKVYSGYEDLEIGLGCRIHGVDEIMCPDKGAPSMHKPNLDISQDVR